MEVAQDLMADADQFLFPQNGPRSAETPLTGCLSPLGPGGRSRPAGLLALRGVDLHLLRLIEDS
jgi:hypothetical protein